MFILTILFFLLILSVLVLIHEAGHFFVALKLGMKVEEFGFGFPPRALSFKRHGIVYSINWIPIGGFVKLYGEDAAGGGSLKIINNKSQILNKKIDEAFFNRPVSHRAIVVLAGVIMNTFLAAVIFYIFLGLSNFKTTLPLIGDHKFFFVNQQNKIDNTLIIDKVSKNSPAFSAGIKPPVKLISVNNKKITNPDVFVQEVNKMKGKEITLGYQDLKSGQIFVTKLIPRVNPPKDQGAIGVRFGPVSLPTAVLSYDTILEKIFSGISHPLNLLSYTFDVMGKLVGISFQEKSLSPVSEGVSGPVGIGTVVSDQLSLPTLKEKVMGLLNLAGLLSISLAFFNVLPIPSLDGGRLFFILIEAVTRRKVNPKIEGYAHSIGMAILLGLIALVTFHDILRLIK